MISLINILNKVKETSDPQSGNAAPYGSGYAPVKELITDTEVICDNCGWKWKIVDGGKDPYTCHKCNYNNKEMKLTEIMKEMAKTDIHFQNIVSTFVNSDNHTKKNIAKYVSGQPHLDLDKLEYDLLHLDYDDVIEIENELGIYALEEACWDGYRKQGMKKKGNRMVPNCVRVSEEKKTGKVNPAYLTKDAAEMKKDIKARKNLKSDDPAAYGKWDADYSDEAMTKKYKTRKSAATVAYQKRFGKKEK